MPKKTNATKELMAKFVEAPTREGLRELIQNNIGEFSHTDFKAEWPELAKVARHVLAFANSGGGALIIGVGEKDDKSVEPVGLAEIRDKVEVVKVMANLLPHALAQNVTIWDFSFDETEYAKMKGKKFQVLLVPDDPRRIPFLATRETTGLKNTVVYVRGLASSDEATHEQLQDVINRRLATGHSTGNLLTLQDHMNHLQTLYGLLQRNYQSIKGFEGLVNLSNLMGITHQANEKYPKEDYEDFVIRMIVQKKKAIEHFLGVETI